MKRPVGCWSIVGDEKPRWKVETLRNSSPARQDATVIYCTIRTIMREKRREKETIIDERPVLDSTSGETKRWEFIKNFRLNYLRRMINVPIDRRIQNIRCMKSFKSSAFYRSTKNHFKMRYTQKTRIRHGPVRQNSEFSDPIDDGRVSRGFRGLAILSEKEAVAPVGTLLRSERAISRNSELSRPPTMR